MKPATYFFYLDFLEYYQNLIILYKPNTQKFRGVDNKDHTLSHGSSYHSPLPFLLIAARQSLFKFSFMCVWGGGQKRKMHKYFYCTFSFFNSPWRIFIYCNSYTYLSFNHSLTIDIWPENLFFFKSPYLPPSLSPFTLAIFPHLMLAFFIYSTFPPLLLCHYQFLPM